jgi:hypothetical protein
MEDILFLDLSFLGFMSTLKGQPLDTTVYGDDPSYAWPSSEIPDRDDEQIRQSRRRERVKDRRAEESRMHR